MSLSVDFLRLVLAVVDDHARSQGQLEKPPQSLKITATEAAGDARSDSIPSPTVGRALSEVLPLSPTTGGVGVGFRAGGGGGGYATASSLFSVDDLPRLYHGPGAIVRKLVRACKGEEPSGEVRKRDRGKGAFMLWFRFGT